MSASASDIKITERLANYMAEARSRKLPTEVVGKAKHHIVDTVAAMVSGASLRPGQMAVAYVRALGGTPEAQVITTDITASAANAALANGILAHADETDDTHLATKCHPGCGVVPAALAMAEREQANGTEFLRAVALGYDLCCRVVRALDPAHLHRAHRSTQGIGPTFGAAAAAASLAKLDPTQMRYVLSFAAQQASGIRSWSRDLEHIEKAFDFGGMGARNGITAAMMVQAGFTGVADVLEGEHNLLNAFSNNPQPEALLDRLGYVYEISHTAIKPFPVGYPIQAALEALLKIMEQHRIRASDVERVAARLPEDGARIVDSREMPDISIQHVLAVTLVEGRVTFALTHSYERMKEPAVLAMKSRIDLQADPTLMDPDFPRQAIIEMVTKDGRTLSHHTKAPLGTPHNPMTTEQINAKARDLMTPLLGAHRTEQLIAKLQDLESLRNMRELGPLLMA